MFSTNGANKHHKTFSATITFALNRRHVVPAQRSSPIPAVKNFIIRRGRIIIKNNALRMFFRRAEKIRPKSIILFLLLDQNW